MFAGERSEPCRQMKCIKAGARQFQAAYQKVVHRLTLSDRATSTSVKKILDAVRTQGDRAVIRYTHRFDGVRLSLDQLRVTPQEIAAAYEKADPAVVESFRYAAKRITAFHQRQKVKGFSIQKDGVYLAQRVHPIERVGLYVPGGKAAYPSSVLMNAIPARVAGVPRLILCSPNVEANAHSLIAADIVGVDEIYRVGGAQAIGAMAYGTEIIPKVDKIVGPGNRYVAMAKRQVYGTVGIDMIAGPSELLILADSGANPRYLASDLLSQAEHDEEAVVVFITTSEGLAKQVDKELKAQLAALPRRKIAAAALRQRGVMFIVPEMNMAVAMANEIAPEHLALFTADPLSLSGQITHAGSVFAGEMTPQALGDYLAGPNHVLPTGGTARFSSPLGVEDFIRRSSVVSYDEKALVRDGAHLVRMAQVEGLDAHANMVKIRMK